MNKRDTKRMITAKLIEQYAVYLQEQEKSPATIEKYIRDLTALCEYLSGAGVTKTDLLLWKENLMERYAASSVNTILAAVNGLLDFCGWGDLKVKPLKIQRNLFCREDQELTKAEYLRLVHAAHDAGNERLALILQTICATGIRVPELQYITIESVQTGRAVVHCKGKTRAVFLPGKLKQALRCYIRKQKRTTGSVFVTRTGKTIDRSNIWRDMKNLCESAGVTPGKVFPHNLRHLFARTYYSLEKDLSRLADILGHTSVSTTRIYTIESGAVHRGQMERMGLVIT